MREIIQQQNHMLDYDIDYDNTIVTLLIDNGYEVDGTYVHRYSSCPSDVYAVSKNGKYFYAKNYVTTETYTWDEMKILLNTLYQLELTPDLEEFIDIDEKSGVIINHSFGQSYEEFSENDLEIKSLVMEAINKLHKEGYVHGDIHMDNILIDKITKRVKFIDLDSCLHKDDPRCLIFLKQHYGLNSLDSAYELERSNINFRV